MEQVTIVFRRVFDLHRIESSRYITRHTLFSFEAEGLTKYSVRVPGWPEIKVGTTVTALLRKPENWQTVIGWVNHESGEVSEERIAYPYLPTFTAACMGIIWGFAMLSSERRALQVVLGFMVTICVASAVSSVALARRRASDSTALAMLKAQLKPTVTSEHLG
ncbi:MAG: hypothetical protein EOO15_14130 [Chitinophagaceae bacterium]|nr:MAG: hypothetical protein EOO15_14130 [Chitinophagaceae bacterium]